MIKTKRYLHARRILGIPLAAAAAAGTLVLAGGGGAAWALASAAVTPDAPATALYQCIQFDKSIGQRVAAVNFTSKANYDAYLARYGGNCPNGGFKETTGLPGGVSVTGASVNGSGDLVLTFSNGTSKDAGHVAGTNGTNGTSATPVTATASTAISDDADSGNSGNWAVDTLTRSMTVTRHGAAAVSNCGGTATNGITSCYYYTAAMTDSGSFVTDSGAKSPQAGTAISGVLSGTLSGGSNYEFYSSSGAPDASLVPATFDASAGSGSGTWPERFFPSGTSFGGVNEINWVYTYSAPTTCEQWTDSYDNSDGSLAADGDISGTNACKS